jgi:hypothetical protein
MKPPTSKFTLLTRDQFRESVFKRDNHQCVVCKLPAKDAHHIIERRLWTNGGYFIENGASLCEECHLKAESTEISCETLRELIGITSFPVPDHLYRDQNYDKWGNPILPNGMRLKGELFNDASVQSIIAPMLHVFTNRVKYPRTYHLPWSPGLTKDDRVMESLNGLISAPEVVVTVKMDGENTTMYNDYLHARSIEYDPHPSRSWIKALHGRIAHDIPAGWRVCGENLYAKHSIHYQNLEDYFQVFSIWNEHNVCLSCKYTNDWAELLGLKVVPVIYQGVFDEKLIKSLYTKDHNGDECEGYVVRTTDSFHYREFRFVAGKYVRANHVQTHNFWRNQMVVPNKVK